MFYIGRFQQIEGTRSVHEAAMYQQNVTPENVTKYRHTLKRTTINNSSMKHSLKQLFTTDSHRSQE